VAVGDSETIAVGRDLICPTPSGVVIVTGKVPLLAGLAALAGPDPAELPQPAAQIANAAIAASARQCGIHRMLILRYVVEDEVRSPRR
jgi:hypothetical protein